jgi:hypothetical protein
MTQARIQLLAGGLLVVTFAVGCLVGAASDRVLNAHEPGPATPVAVTKTTTPRNDSKPRARFIDAAMLDEIGVTPSQRATIDSILDVRDREAKKLWKEWEPHFKAMMQETRGQVRAQLTTEQIKELDALIEQRKAERKQQQAAPAPNEVQSEQKPKSEKHNPPPSEDNKEQTPRRYESIALQ